jgi:hypothetical protein
MVCSRIDEGYVILSNLNKTFATTWVLPNLYIVVKSYSRNNNNHLIIIPKTYRWFTK